METGGAGARPATNTRRAAARPALREQLSGELARLLVRHMAGEMAALPLVEWGRALLPGYFRLPPSTMHRWIGEQLDRASATNGRPLKLNVLGPRGGAKSTIVTLCYVLRQAVEGREPYIWIVSDTIGQARTHLANVKAELEKNPLLAAHYPRAIGRGSRWRSSALELPNGVCIEAYGTGQHLRGRRRRQHRPSLIVCDDLQNDQHVLSATQRQSSRDWFQGALLKAGDSRTNLINLATALHREALAMQLDRSPGWTSRVFRAIERWPDNIDLWDQWESLYADQEDRAAREKADQFFAAHREAMHAGAELLWPEHEDLYTLMRMRVEEGRTAFEREKQNWPVDPERCEFPEEYFGPHIWFRHWPADLVVRVVALDPSKGADARRGDYSAYVLLGIDSHGVLHVEADLARRPTPVMVADGVAICARFEPDAVGVEASQYQELLVGEFEEALGRQKHRAWQVTPIHNSVNKTMRIRRLGKYLAQRRVRFLVPSAGTKLLVDQLRDFPIAGHDDGPDAMEMALRLAESLTSLPPPDDGLGNRLILG